MVVFGDAKKLRTAFKHILKAWWWDSKG